LVNPGFGNSRNDLFRELTSAIVSLPLVFAVASGAGPAAAHAKPV
jgi:MFS superfamily sulfate permease-like transporter